MSHFYSKFVFSINATTKIATIPSTSATATTTSSTAAPIAVVAGVLSDSMRKEAMDVVVAKIICLLILTILSVLSGLLPLRLLIHTPHLFSRGRNSVDYFLCGLRLFSGGKGICSMSPVIKAQTQLFLFTNYIDKPVQLANYLDKPVQLTNNLGKLLKLLIT